MYSQVPSKDDDFLLQRNDKKSLSVSERKMSEERERERESDCCGLNNQNPDIKKAARLKFCLGCVGILAVLLPLLFLVIIPQATQHLVNQSDLIILQANIINPNDISFTSKVTQKFSNVQSAEGTLQMHRISLLWNDGTGNKKLASLTHSNDLTIGTNTVNLKSQANVEDVNALSEFNLFAITADIFQWKIKGTASVETSGLHIPVDINKNVQMKGFNNFPTPPIINQINITGGTSLTILNKIAATFTNDANIAITFGQNIIFTLKSEGFIIGSGIIPDLNLMTGEFPISADVTLSAVSGTSEYDQLMKVISQYTCGVDSPVTMGPFEATTTIKWLEAGLASMNLETSIPGLKQKLIVSSDLYPTGALQIPFTMNMQNPIDTIFIVTHIKATINSNGTDISTIDSDVDITIPARSTIISPEIIANAIPTPAALTELARLQLVGFGLLDIKSTLTGYINEFPTLSAYAQNQVPATIHH